MFFAFTSLALSITVEKNSMFPAFLDFEDISFVKLDVLIVMPAAKD